MNKAFRSVVTIVVAVAFVLGAATAGALICTAVVRVFGWAFDLGWGEEVRTAAAVLSGITAVITGIAVTINADGYGLGWWGALHNGIQAARLPAWLRKSTLPKPEGRP